MATGQPSSTQTCSGLCSSRLQEAEQPGAALHRSPVTVQITLDENAHRSAGHAADELASELENARRELQSVTEERDNVRELNRSLQKRLRGAQEMAAQAKDPAQPAVDPSSSFLRWRTSATARRSLMQAAAGDLLEGRALEAEKRAKESAEALRQRDEALQQRDEQVSALASQVESLTSQVEGLQRLLRHRNEQIASEGEVEGLHDLLRQRDEQIESLTSQVDAPEQEQPVERPLKAKEDMDLRASLLIALPDKCFGASKFGDDDAQTEVPDGSDAGSAPPPPAHRVIHFFLL
ncbi:unnamed protein product, partial [Prorocentrum cordatum]